MTLPVYNPGTPQPFDPHNVTQPSILNNFQQLNEIFDVDHITFDEVTHNGYHKKISFAETSPRPDLRSPASSVYTKLNQQNFQELFFNNNPGAAFEFALTMQSMVVTSGGTGFRTPWGLIINMGEVNFLGVTNYLFPIPYSSLADIFTIVASPLINYQGSVTIAAVSNTTFGTVGNVGKGYYISIGR